VEGIDPAPTDRAGHAFRTDIQALRGFAVAIVVLYHAGLGVPSGYLGVDVFFVVSGFLITRLVADAIDEGRFSLPEFYFRRAKRLLPAAYVTLVAVLIAAPWLLGGTELRDFGRQVEGAVTFRTNYVLMRQTGYFEGGAELKPLLHLWSLAIEEQLYFLLPMVLLLAPRRLWVPGAVGATALSLAVFLMLAGNERTFYRFPTRVWELGLGAVGALWLQRRGNGGAVRTLFPVALIALIALPLLPLRALPFGRAEIAIDIATLVVLLRDHRAASRVGFVRALSRIGDVSYSLYLVHWPILAFYHNAWLGVRGAEPPVTHRVALVALGCAVAVLLHRVVEEPIRRAPVRRRAPFIAAGVVSSVAILLAGMHLAAGTARRAAYAPYRAPARGFAGCRPSLSVNRGPECRNADEPEILLWGDSHAMHLVPGLAASLPTPRFAQATRAGCVAFTALSVPDRHGNRAAAAQCIRFNRSVIAHLQRHPSIRTVVLAGAMAWLDHDTATVVHRRNGRFDVRHLQRGQGHALALDAMRATVKQLRAMGKRVVFVASPPFGPFDVGRCLERMHLGLVTVDSEIDAGCAIRRADYERTRRGALAFLTGVSTHADLDVIRLDAFLCDQARCLTQLGGIPLYVDDNHLNAPGSVVLAREVDLLGQIRRLAR